MRITDILQSEKSSLITFTDQQRKPAFIAWYRTPLPKEQWKALHERSDLKGFIQTGGYFLILFGTGTLAFLSWLYGSPWATACLVFIYGMVTAFLSNAVHELGHGTVFQTKWLNSLFCALFAFLSWNNHEMFQRSHTRHHRYTLHPPDDLEVVLPIRLMIRHLLLTGIVNPHFAWAALTTTIRIARSRFQGEWEMTLYPVSESEKRADVVRWARIFLIGHSSIIIISLVMGLWIIPVLLTLAPFYGGWLFFLCNNTQHIGLQDNVPDFRLCCRTFTINPLLRFLYWQMNYHTEHHMYAAVPCYNLGKLHQLIKHDLPPCSAGLIAVWREIAAIQAAQECDPSYQYIAPLPNSYNEPSSS